MLRASGARVEAVLRSSMPTAPAPATVTVEPCERLRPPDMTVPGDLSSAAFHLVAALIVPGRAVRIEGVGLNPSRTALLEILQNCPVYNDDEWIEVEDRKQRIEASLVLEDGHPLVWGTEDQRKGIRIENGIPSVVHLGAGEDPVAKGVAVHHERHESPAYACALASLHRPQFPVPIGVFRAVPKPTYDALIGEQVERAVESRGRGDLGTLLHSGDTWTVD